MSIHDDLYDAPRPELIHPRMSMNERAAQFSPFAALKGHDDAISETARPVDRKIELSEEEKELLGHRTDMIVERPGREVYITYFIPDERKRGGVYLTISGVVKKVDTDERTIIMTSGEVIAFDDVLEIEGEMFDENRRP